MNDFEKIHTEIVPEKQFDLCITLDASDKERLGGYAVYFDSAAKTLCIDHHRTNTGFAEQNYIIPDASSCSEVLYTLLDEAKISREAAECLYTGIVHDTGVFKYNSTTRKTMEIAGALMEKGVNAAKIIDDSFYRKTYAQNQILGKALLGSTRILDGRCIFSVVSQKEMEFYSVDTNDLDGIIDQLRITEGVECAFSSMKGVQRVQGQPSFQRLCRCEQGGGVFRRRRTHPRGGLHDAGTSEGCDQQPDGTY